MADKKAGELSYGQQKLVDIAMAFMSEPDLVLLDEPCAGVNPSLVGRHQHLAEGAEPPTPSSAKSSSFVVIEHNMDFVMDLCHRIMVMVEGKVMAIGTPGRNPQQQASAGRLPGQLSLSMTDDTCIEFDDVVAGYKDFMILNNLSFKAKRGHHHPAAGPQWRGQIHGAQNPVWLAQTAPGRHLAGRRERRGRHPKSNCLAKGIAFVPQGRNLFGQLSVFENLELGGITLGMKTTHERIPEVLEFFPRVKPAHEFMASALSGGRAKAAGNWPRPALAPQGDLD